MKLLISLLFTGLVLNGPMHGQTRRPPEPPKFPPTFVGKPEFQTPEGNGGAGAAFLARGPDGRGVFILTLRNMLGPEGGFKELIPAQKLPDFVKNIRIRSFSGVGSANYPVEGQVVPGALDPVGLLADLAFFRAVGQTHTGAVDLAQQPPKVGDTVWMIAKIGSPAGIIHPATVLPSEGANLVIQFEKSATSPSGASGAPILNAEGEAVGVFLSQRDATGGMQAIAISAPNIILAMQGRPLPSQ